jgi:hypothetical protein
LGLPIAKSDNFFVESWVNPNDLIRPCVDPEINAASCECDNTPGHKKGSSEYMKWYDTEKAGKYTGQWQFPWTRLGYTYDWGKEGADKFGVSEFVIRPGATIEIKSITSTAAY